MVNGWTAREACALQSAMRLSNQAYAAHLGIGLTTITDWHAKPGLRPRPAMQQILDSALAQAADAVRERFATLISEPAPVDGDEAGRAVPGDVPRVAAGIVHGVVSAASGATIDARTILPAAAVRPPAEVAAAPALHNLPAPRNAVFVDREGTLAELDAAMSGEAGVPPVVHGLGGTGKSTLALHYAHQSRDRHNPVWWISADSPVSVTRGLAELAARLNPHDDLVAKTSADGAAWAVDWLRSHTGWLLVFDDADSPATLETVLGTLAGGRHLITSRRASGWHRVARSLPLAVLRPDAAVDMLAQITGPGGDDGRADLGEIARELGYLPLALNQAAAYIQRTAITPAAYLDRVRRFPALMFATSAGADAAGESGRQRTIARTWQLSLQAITAEQPLASDILSTLAWYSPDPIPRDLAYELHQDPITVDDALALLSAYSMITLTPQSVTIHRLVQAVARTPDLADPHRAPDTITRARDRAAEMLLAALPVSPLFAVPSWPRWRELTPHVLALADHVAPDQDTTVTAAILSAASGFLQGDGHHEQAIVAARRAAGSYERLQGPDAADTLTARSFVASAYRAAGNIAEAEPLHEQNLADAERVLGPDHPETLVARADLAYLYALQDQPSRALDLHARNLADYERVLGPDHPHTLNARANLASSYRALGDLTSAIELHEQSAADYARILGPGHAETVTARSNLAYAYQLAGDHDRAVPLHRQVLADRERLYGPDHHFTNLARLLLSTAEQQAPEPGNSRSQ